MATLGEPSARVVWRGFVTEWEDIVTGTNVLLESSGEKAAETELLDM